jgi:tetratricopeptide (TPR) repeat protein
MKNLHQITRSGFPFAAIAACVTLGLTGCGPHYQELRLEGQRAMLRGEYRPAQYFFLQADEKKANVPANLHDLGFCSFMLARMNFEQMNRVVAMREVDAAIEYYTRAIDSHPGHQASIVGKNLALELKGQFDEALKHAEWAAEFVGPSAKQYIFLAQELEERGDDDGALLSYRQAVAMEPRNPVPHVAIAKFLLRHRNEPPAVIHLQEAYRLNPRDQWVADQLIARGKLPPLAPKPGDTP